MFLIFGESKPQRSYKKGSYEKKVYLVKEPEMFKKNLVTEAEHVFKMFLLYCQI